MSHGIVTTLLVIGAILLAFALAFSLRALLNRYEARRARANPPPSREP